MDSIVRNPTALGAALRRQRKKMRLSQGELGERINLRQATISASAMPSPISGSLRSRSTASDTDIEAAF